MFCSSYVQKCKNPQRSTFTSTNEWLYTAAVSASAFIHACAYLSLQVQKGRSTHGGTGEEAIVGQTVLKSFCSLTNQVRLSVFLADPIGSSTVLYGAANVNRHVSADTLSCPLKTDG